MNGAMEASLSTEGREGTTGNMFFPDSYVFLSPVTARGASRTRNQINLRSPKTELGLVFGFDHASRKFNTCEEQVKAVKERLLGCFKRLPSRLCPAETSFACPWLFTRGVVAPSSLENCTLVEATNIAHQMATQWHCQMQTSGGGSCAWPA